MRLLFCSRPAYGHLYPMMPLALAARDAGHEVVFATTGRFVEMLPAAGFAVVDAGITMEAARAQLHGADWFARFGRQDGRPDLEVAARFFIEVLGARSAADLAPRLDELAPDVVVYEQGDFGAAVAAGAAGIPAVCHAISPRTVIPALEPASRRHLARLWERHGVQSPPLDVFTGDAYLDIVPDSLQLASFLDDAARVAVRPTPWAEPGAALPGWVGARGRPLVYLTLGTVVGQAGNLAPAVEALGRLDADVLVALGSARADGLPRCASNVHVVPFVDQRGVLPHADLVVHHGGSGTMLGALSHARRQLVLPKGADQFFNADALRHAGMATVIEPDDASVEAIEAAARAALEAPVPARVLTARDEIAAMPPPADALDAVLDRVAARSRAPRSISIVN